MLHMSQEELLAILKEMPLRSEEIRDNVWYLEKANNFTAFNLMNIFNYGYMMGKRDERAKKKAVS